MFVKRFLGERKRIMALIKLYEGNGYLWNACSADYKTQVKNRNAKIKIRIHFGLSGVYLLCFKDIFATVLHYSDTWDSLGDQHGPYIYGRMYGCQKVSSVHMVHIYGCPK